MIFATVGTHGQPFERLIRALETLPGNELVVQHGHSRPPRGAAHAAAFMPFPEVLWRIEAAEAVIMHAGVGTILCARRAGHTPLVVPRLRRHGEHVDDHQLELARALGEREAVIAVWEPQRLSEALGAIPPRRAPEALAEKPIHAAVRAALVGQPERMPVAG